MYHRFGLLLILFVMFSTTTAQAEDSATAMRRIGAEVALLELGFGPYVLGQALSEEQLKFSRDHLVEDSIPGTFKFQDGDIYVVVKADDNMVLGVYKQFKNVARPKVKEVVGDLMMRFDEPTTMAHGKMIYWAYGKNGKVSEDAFEASKKIGDSDIIATVKFNSTEPVFPGSAGMGNTQQAPEDGTDADIYVIITSDPLSKIFLAEHGRKSS